MTIQPVLIMGNPQLYELSKPVTDFDTAALRNKVKDLHETMLAEGGIGIAAPQIGLQEQIIIFGFEKSDRYPNAQPIPFTILINPTIEVISDKLIEGWEGCLSVPGMRGLVPRYETIIFSGFNMQGEPITQTVSDFYARVVQHETDHLNGVLYPHRIKDLRYFGFNKEIKNLMMQDGR